jgi:hypothetical protein
MDGIPPSLCPTGFYRPPQRLPALADIPPPPSRPRRKLWSLRALRRLFETAWRLGAGRFATPGEGARTNDRAAEQPSEQDRRMT